MKKIFLFTFVYTLFACSSGDDNNSSSGSINEYLVGAWFGIITDTEITGLTAEQTITFNSDGSFSISNIWDDGETYFDVGTWSSTSSTLTLVDSNGIQTSDYELSNNNNTCIMTRIDGVVIIYKRIC
jgi:hypothetical protein